MSPRLDAMILPVKLAEPSGMQLISDSEGSLGMAEITILDYFVIGEAIGIVGAFFVGFYYSRKQMQKLSVDIESKILNDLRTI